jgi:hypothetical protein
MLQAQHLLLLTMTTMMLKFSSSLLQAQHLLLLTMTTMMLMMMMMMMMMMMVTLINKHLTVMGIILFLSAAGTAPTDAHHGNQGAYNNDDVYFD